jgi:hypothetical protein
MVELNAEESIWLKQMDESAEEFLQKFQAQFLHALACGRRLVEQSIGVYFFYLITVLLLFLYNESKAKQAHYHCPPYPPCNRQVEHSSYLPS